MIRLVFMVALAIALTGTLACAGWTLKSLGMPPRTLQDPDAIEGSEPTGHGVRGWDNMAILGLVTLFSLSFTSGAGLVLVRLGLP